MTHPRSSASIRRRLAFSTALATGLVATLAPSTALAQQVTNVGTIQAGGVTSNGGLPTIVDSNGVNTTTITVGGSRTIINWTDLNVGNSQTLNFVVGANTDAVLNRVLVGTTTINGNLSSYIGSVGGTTGGQIFILNTNGVIFGGSAAVNVGGLVAGTLGITDTDFNDGGSYSFSGGTASLLTVTAGANLNATNGPLVLVAGTLTNAGSLTSVGDIALVAASDVTMTLDPGSPVSMTINDGTSVNAALVAGGTISGRNVTLAVVGRNSVAEALLTVSGVVTATGAALTDRGVVLTAGASATGVTVAGSNGAIGAPGAIDQTGAISSASDVELRATSAIEGTAAINAGRDVMGSAPFITLGPVTATRDIALSGQIGDEFAVVSLTAGSDISLNGAVSGIDIALSAGDQITTQALTARDDIVIRAIGSVSTGTIATGTTINGALATDVAGAGDTLAATTLAGNDLNVAANGFVSGAINAIGAGSDVTINGGANGIGSGLSDLSITAEGNIQLIGQAKGIDVALDAGGTITTADIVARDDIVLRATGQILTDDLTSGTTVDASAPLDPAGAGDSLAGGTLSGNDVDLAGDGVMVGRVRAIGGGSDIRIAGGANGIGNGGLDLDLDAGQNIDLTSNARGLDIALNANGSITTLNLDARDDVIAVAGSNLTVGQVSTGITIDALAAVDVAGAADTLGSAQVPAVTLTGNSAYLSAGNTLTINSPANIVSNLTLRASSFAGQDVFNHNVGTLLRVIDRTGDFVINDAVSETYSIALEAETGSIIVNNNITSTAGSLSLTATTPGEAIRLDDFNLTAGTSITLNGVTDVRDTVTIDAGTTATFNGAIIGDGQAGGSNDPDFLTIDSGTGTFFNGTVGSGTANQSLQSLTVTGGVSTLNAAFIQTNAGISLAGLTTGNQAAVTIDAGSGTLISTGDISASQAGTALTLDGSSITVTNVGSGAFPFSTIGFNAPTNLGGNVTATGAITFTGNLVLLDDGNTGNVTTRQISSTGTSAITFQQNISSQGNNVVGLAVSNPNGSVVFSKDVGLNGAALAALGIAAKTFDSSALVTDGGKFRVGVLAINVAQGDIVLPAEGALTIGTVGSIVGLSTLAAGSGTGRIEVSTPNGSDLTINGQVQAFGSIILSAGDDLLGSAAITAGFNGGLATSDVTITAVDTVNTGSIAAPDAVSVTGGGLVTTGAIASNSVAITGNGIRPGAITVQTSINLNGGAGGIGDGTRDLSLSTPGSITLAGEARGIDIALSSTGGGAITTGALRARDDVVILTTGAISTGAISTGVTVDSLAAIDVAGAGDTLHGLVLVGNDVAISGASIVTGAVRATGSSSDIQFFNAASGIGSSLVDLDLQAGGSIILPNVTAQGRDIALSAGTAVSTGALTAADDIVIRAGTSATLGAVSATGGVDVAGAADTLAGRTLTGADADLSATGSLSYTSVTLGDDLTLRAQNVDAILLAPLPVVGGDISLTDTGGGLVITSFAATNGSLTIATENGNLSVGGVSAADNVNLSVSNGAAGELILTGGVTAGAGDAVSLVSSGLIRQDAGVITASSLSGSSVGATTLSGANVVANLAGFTANGLTFNVTGPLTITNAVDGGSALSLTAGGSIAINALTGTSGIMTLVSGGAITQTAAIEAAVLTGSSTGATTLNNPANAIGSIGSAATAGGFSSGGNFSLVDVGGLTIAKALSSTSGGVSVDTSGALAVNANVTGAGIGIVRLDGNGISLLSGITVSTGSGAITIDSGAGFASGATISTGGAVTIGAVGDLALNSGSVSGNGVALNATGGAGSDILVNAAINGGTGLLAIAAGGTVTSNAAGTLTTSGAGRVTVNSGSDMSLSGAIAAGSGGLALTSGGLLGLLANASAAGSGTVVLDSVGLMTLASGITLASGSGAITLDSDAGLISSAVISTTGAVSATADGDLQLLAGSISGNGITLNAIGANSDATLNAALNGGAGGVGVTAGGTIISNASGTITATGAGAINLDSGGLMTLGGAISGGSGAVLLDSGGALSVNAAVNTGGAVTGLANGDILVGGNVTGNGITLTATGAGSDATLNAALNGGAGGVKVTAAGTIASIAAGTVTASGTGLITLDSGAAMTIGGAISGGTGAVLLDSGGALSVNAAVSTGGSVTGLANGALAIGAAITGNGITLNAIGASSNATIDAALNGGAGGVAVTAGGTIISNGSGTVTATGAGAINLDSGGLMTLGGAISGGTGAILLDSGGALTIDATVNGGGSVTGLANGDLAVGAGISGSGITLNAIGANSDATLYAALSAGAGGVSVTAGGTITSIGAGTIAATGAGAINLDSGGLMTIGGAITGSTGAILLDSGGGLITSAAIGTGGAVTGLANGDILVGGNVTGNGITLTATGAGSDATLNAALNGGAGGVRVTAGGTIISNGSGTVTATGAGAINLDSGGLMTLGGAISGGSGAILLDSGGALTTSAGVSTSGSVTGLANGDIVVGGNVTGNGITLTATGVGSDATLNAALNGGAGGVRVTAGGTITSIAAGSVTASGTGLITLDSGGFMTLGGAITGGTGAILLDSGGALTTSAGVSTGGSVTGLANGDILVGGNVTGNGITLTATGAGSDATLNAALNGGAGGVSVTAGGTITSIAAGTVTATGSGLITLDSGAAMTIGGAVTGGTGAILLDSGGTLITSAAVSTSGSVTGLANGNLLVGGAIAGTGVTLTASGGASTLTINAPVNAGSGTLALTGPAGISQSAAGLLTAGLLTVSSNGLVNLGAATNAITALGAVNTAGFSLLDGGGLILNGAVQGNGGVSIVTSGPLTVSTAITTTNSAITLNAGTGALNLAAAVNAGTGTVDLRGATIGQTAAGIVTAGTLTGLSTGATLLDTATNAVAAIGNFSAERLALRTAGALAITGNLTATGVASAQPGILLTAGGISQTAASVVDGGVQAIRFDANGGTVTLAGELRSSATGPAIAIVDAGAVSLGTVRAASGTLVLGETGAAVGAVTQTGPIEAAMLTAVATGSPITLSNAANSIGALGPISATALTLTDAVGGLDIAGDLRIAGTLNLTVPNGAVTQSAGTIEAALLRGSSNGGATFTRAGNNIVAVGPWTNANAGGFNFTSAFALSLAGDIAAGTGPLNLTALSIAGAGRTLTSGGIATLAATGGDLNVGTVTAGPSATLTATNAVIAGTVTAGAVTASGVSVDIGTATASSGALALTASSGLLRLGTGSAGTTATLIKQGTTGQLEIGTRLSTQGNVTVTSATNARIAEISAANGAIAVTASAGSVTGISGDTGAGARLLAGPTGSTQNLTVSATNWVRLGESRGGVISATGARLELTGAVTGTTSILFDNNGTGATRLGSVADSDGFSLGQAEMDFARAPTITIQSRANPIAIGDLTLSTATGATRLNLLTSGRIDVTGRFQGGLAGRTIQLGGITASNASGGAAVSNVSTILAVSATAGGGGRLLFEGSTLDLRAAKIGVGQDVGFLGADGMGLTGTGSTPIVQGEVSRRFIGNSSSTLYRATAPYSDPVLIKAGQIVVTYADYAVFQNGALAGTRAGGVTLAGSLRPMLSLNSSGPSGANAFAMFAEIDGRFGLEAAVLPRTFVELNNVNLGNTRINGCLAGSAAGGCIINNVAPPLINVFDAGRADVLNAAGDLPIAFDPIVGANNESLFAGLSSIEDIAADPDCKPDDKGTTCPAPERTQ